MISAEALFRIGDAAEDREDFELARRSFEQGAALGDEHCLCRLALLFDVGRGVETDKLFAMRLYLRAWRLGNNTVAANNIAVLYREKGNNRGVVRWLRRAIEYGDDGARFELAKLYLKGEGVPKSPGDAMRLLAGASAGNLSEAEREEANALIANLRPRLVHASRD